MLQNLLLKVCYVVSMLNIILGPTPIQYFANLFVGYHTKPVENYACCKVLRNCAVPFKGQKSLTYILGNGRTHL
jgi:hypothetical protein